MIWCYEKIYVFFFYFRITQFQIKYCNNHLMYRCVRSQLWIWGTHTNKRHGTNVCWEHHRTTAVYNKCLLLYQLQGIHTQHHRWNYWIKIQTWTVLHVHMEQRQTFIDKIFNMSHICSYTYYTWSDTIKTSEGITLAREIIQ